MATISTTAPLLCLSSLLLLSFRASLAQQSFGSPWQSSARGGPRGGQRQCRFERLGALEKVRQVRFQAGFVEHYDLDRREEFRCAGISVRRLVIERNGLAVPAYGNVHKLMYIVEGRGIFGIAMPGCPATFQSTWSPLEEQQMPSAASEGQQQLRDEHQKISEFRQGDIIAMPAGVPHWLYNNGDSPVVAISFFDTGSSDNQLDPTVREFLLGGPGQPRSGEQQYSYGAEQQTAAHNIFPGFNQDLLAEALGVSRHVASRLQGQSDRRGAIVRVERGLQALRPSLWGEPRLPRQQQQQQRRQRYDDPYTTGRQPATTSPRSGDFTRQPNGIDETVCSMEFSRNVHSPQSTDVYNPRAGRITRANSQNFPVLSILQMSVTRAVLQSNALVTPHWSVNAHTVMYVSAGQGRVQVVDNRGRRVFDGELRHGQILLIPQTFAVVVKARQDGFAWVSVKTNANAMESQIAGKQSVLRALPVDVLASAFGLSREESRPLKFNRGEETAVFTPRHGQRAYMPDLVQEE